MTRRDRSNRKKPSRMSFLWWTTPPLRSQKLLLPPVASLTLTLRVRQPVVRWQAKIFVKSDRRWTGPLSRSAPLRANSPADLAKQEARSVKLRALLMLGSEPSTKRWLSANKMRMMLLLVRMKQSLRRGSPKSLDYSRTLRMPISHRELCECARESKMAKNRTSIVMTRRQRQKKLVMKTMKHRTKISWPGYTRMKNSCMRRLYWRSSLSRRQKPHKRARVSSMRWTTFWKIYNLGKLSVWTHRIAALWKNRKSRSRLKMNHRWPI